MHSHTQIYRNQRKRPSACMDTQRSNTHKPEPALEWGRSAAGRCSCHSYSAPSLPLPGSLGLRTEKENEGNSYLIKQKGDKLLSLLCSHSLEPKLNQEKPLMKIIVLRGRSRVPSRRAETWAGFGLKLWTVGQSAKVSGNNFMLLLLLVTLQIQVTKSSNN